VAHSVCAFCHSIHCCVWLVCTVEDSFVSTPVTHGLTAMLVSAFQIQDSFDVSVIYTASSNILYVCNQLQYSASAHHINLVVITVCD